MLERVETLESKQASQEASMAAVMNEFRCLRAHVDLLEARMRYAGMNLGNLGNQGSVASDKGQNEDQSMADKSGEIEHDVTAAELAAMDEAHENYTMSPTMWEVPVFVGAPVLSCGASLMTFFSLVLTIILQLCMIASIYTFGAEFDGQAAVDDIKLWRVTEGHSSMYAHPVTKASLTSRVCAGDSTLSVGMSQADMYGMLESFNLPTAGIPRGPLLCVAVLFVWSLYIVVEWSNIRELMIAFLGVPRAKWTHIYLDPNGENIELRSICSERLAWVLLLQTIRFGISTVLGAMGAFWQIRTKTLENLVLNAGALAFVIADIPELMYNVLVPLKARVLLESMDPLKRSPRKRIKGFEVLMLFDIVCIGVFCGVCGAALGVSREKELAAMSATCDNRQDFIYGKDTFGRLLVAESRSTDVDIMETDGFEVSFIQDLIDGVRSLGPFDAQNIIASMAKPRSVYADDLGYDCRDSASGVRAMWVNGENRTMSCAQARGYCLSSGLVRMHCPEACECDDPFSGMPLTAPNYGCPRRACQQTSSYLNAFRERSCQDLSADYLKANQSWLLLWDNLYTSLLTMSSAEDHEPAVRQFRDTAKTEGCGVFQATGFDVMVMRRFKLREQVNLCDPLGAWCPISCQCDQYKVGKSCPTSC